MSQLFGRTLTGRLCPSINWEYIISPIALARLATLAASYGTLVSGMLFGAGWWFWADAVCVSSHKPPFVQYLPGIIATLAIIMINMIRRDELDNDYDTFDDASFCRPRFWLFLSYVVSFGSVIGAVWVMIANYGSKPDLSGQDKWPGAAGIFQVVFILGSGLMLFVSRSPSENSDVYGGYGAF